MILRKMLAVALMLLPLAGATAQDGINTDYEEAKTTTIENKAAWEQLDAGLHASWASRDVHYKQREVPSIKMKRDTVVYAWRGERVGVEALLFANEAQGKLTLRTASETLECEARFVNYVWTDEFRGCGNHPTDRPAYTVPDVIDRETAKALDACETRPVWCTIEVPQTAEAGTHHVKLEILNAEGEALRELALRVEVKARTLPEPKDYAFNLNFWQQPYAASRYYKVEPWSEAHFDALRPYMQMLARAGQKVATTILFYEPWGEQSNDKFEPMVETSRNAEGAWHFDYTIFDKYVLFLEECGISAQINCFSMVPWDMSFRYRDEATGAYKYLNAQTTDAAYRELWTTFITDFAAHLREKGWFEKTAIAMDERGLSAMLDAYEIAQAAAPGIKMALAGNYHRELVDKLYDYCIAYGQEFTAAELKRRTDAGLPTTCYTACPDAEPNICSNNNPSDAAYLPLHAISKGFNGFLRWAWMNWTNDPLRDTRFRMFTPGDTYIVYPGARSGIRFERIIEGIQAAEKVRLLREEFTREGKTEELQALEAALKPFQTGVLSFPNTSARLVNVLQSVLNDAPAPPAEEVTDYCEVRLSSDKKDVAIAKRYFTSASTTGCEKNLSYKSSQPSETGYVLVEEPIRVRRGKTFTLKTVAKQNDDDLRYCRMALFADWNNDSIFDAQAGELVERRGSANTGNTALLNLSLRIAVPETATPGLSRLRLTFADAWKAEPEACGELYKGFAFDIPMEIIDEASSINAVRLNRGKWRGNTLTLSNPSRIYVYTADGTLLDYADYSSKYTMRDYLCGNYLLVAYDKAGTRSVFKRQIR